MNPGRWLLIDGYNVLYADEGLKRMAAKSLEAAREKLVEMIYQYAEATESRIEVVFDGSTRSGPELSEQIGPRLVVTFTSHDRSADQYIEARIYQEEAGTEGFSVVVTSDYPQQRLVVGRGFLRMSSREMLEEMEEQRIRTRAVLRRKRLFRVTVEDHLSGDVRAALRRLRDRL